MESAIEKLRKYRDKDYHLHDEIIELWTNILSECDLSILGDEKWLILEQVFKSALHCSKEPMAHQCLQKIEKQFEKTSPLLITLNAMYFESIGDFEKAEQICSTLIQENETDDIKKFLGLTNYLLHICRKSHGLPLTCLKLIEGYCQKITKCINDDNSLLNDMKNVLNEIKDLLQLIDLNDIQTAKINRIIGVLESCYSRLSNEINQMKKELLNVKHQYEHQNSALDELRKEMIDLRKQSSMQVLKEASAHLLIPFIEQVTKQSEKENEEQTNLISEEPDDFQKFYNKYYLEIIKSDVALDEGPLTTIDNVINDFVKQSKIAKPDFIDLLINKTNRNRKSHHIIDCYIDNYINNRYTENFIEFLECENSVKLIVDDNDKVNLIKLLKLNSKLRRKQNSLNVFLNQFDTLQERNDMIIAPFRMSIVEQDKENGAIVMGEIESGSCCIGDQCLIMPNQTRVEITNIYHEDSKTDSGVYGQNVQLELKNVEEEKISPGFILCDAQQKPCRVGRIFESEVMIIKHQSKIYPGYIAVLRIHAAVTRVYLKELIKLIDPKTGQTTRKKPKFIKQDQVAIVRFELSQSEQVICMEQFRHFPRLGRFALLNKNGPVAVGKVLKIIE